MDRKPKIVKPEDQEKVAINIRKLVESERTDALRRVRTFATEFEKSINDKFDRIESALTS